MLFDKLRLSALLLSGADNFYKQYFERTWSVTCLTCKISLSMDHDIYLHRKQVFEILCLSRIPSSGNLLVGHIKSKDPKLGFAVKIVAHLCAKACD